MLEAERPDDYVRRLAASDLGRAYKALVVDELQIAPGDTVVDLGCGPGADLSAYSAAVGATGRVLGIDSDSHAVAHAADELVGDQRVEVRVGDIHDLDLADRSVDRIHTDRVLQHVARPEVVVGEAARVLRPGGIAAFAEPDWDTLVIDHPDPATSASYRAFVNDRVVRNARIGRQLPAMCQRNGLRIVRVVPVTAVFRDVVEADRLLGFQRVTARAVRAGYIAAEAAGSWLDHVRSEPFFASVSLFVTVSTPAA